MGSGIADCGAHSCCLLHSPLSRYVDHTLSLADPSFAVPEAFHHARILASKIASQPPPLPPSPPYLITSPRIISSHHHLPGAPVTRGCCVERTARSPSTRSIPMLPPSPPLSQPPSQTPRRPPSQPLRNPSPPPSQLPSQPPSQPPRKPPRKPPSPPPRSPVSSCAAQIASATCGTLVYKTAPGMVAGKFRSFSLVADSHRINRYTFLRVGSRGW